MEHRKCILIFFTMSSETFLILRRIERDMIKEKRKIALHVKLYVILTRFSWNFNSLEVFSKNNKISIIMNILPVGAGLFHADGRTDRYA
jgi:uncharacterized radical SAM superfamily protein